ncbi:HotDog domain-containing protein [Chaetomium fimeti]|uniref:HotDog domain-containing protein n=1 Tax=Chaetomium fimeti TaxID=1854472 RepID=A0AAE0HI41_9PEZI|nr:HotDog domain-containing protein [Chaetomium fimeti]
MALQQPQQQQANVAEIDQQLAFFQAIPWCASHLSDTPTPVIRPSLSQRRRNAPGDVFFSHTLNAPGAIPALVNFHAPPSAHVVADPKGPLGPEPLISRLRALIALGPMLNGWAGVCHGGIVGTLMDETVGQLFVANQDHGLLPQDVPVMTVYQNIRFVKPARTGTVQKPAVVLVTARVVKREGRKFWLEADVQEEGGVVLARAESLFVTPRSML